MNVRFGLAAIVALSATVFAADPVVPVAEPSAASEPASVAAPAATAAPAAEAPAVEPAAPAATAAPAAEAPAVEPAAPAVEQSSVAEPSAVSDPASVVAPVATTVPVEAPVAETPVATTAPVEAPVTEAPVAEASAAEPEAVAPEAEMPAPVAVRGVRADGNAPTASSAAPETYAPAPAAEPVPTGTTYAMGAASADQKPASYVRVLVNPVPMKFEVGIQAFIGYNSLYDNNWDFGDSYSGIAWRAGAFALFPLNEFTMGLKIGILYDHSDAKASYLYSSDLSKEANVKFKQDKISIPFLFSFKATYSRFLFDMGAQFSIPVRDEFKYYYEKSDGTAVDGKADMIDLDYRASLDFALVFGFSVRANDLVSFDARFDLGFSSLYDSVPGWRINDLSGSTFLLGISFHVI